MGIKPLWCDAHLSSRGGKHMVSTAQTSVAQWDEAPLPSLTNGWDGPLLTGGADGTQPPS